MSLKVIAILLSKSSYPSECQMLLAGSFSGRYASCSHAGQLGQSGREVASAYFNETADARQDDLEL